MAVWKFLTSGGVHLHDVHGQSKLHTLNLKTTPINEGSGGD